jgi:DtxR family Mn-dependent transcriptional regulator
MDQTTEGISGKVEKSPKIAVIFLEISVISFKSMEETEMNLSERAEEILETLWVGTVQEKKDSLSLGLSEREEAVSELLKNGFIDISNQKVRLREKGKKEGEKIVRRHRLAERLLVDVLAMKKGVIHEVGCKFEHLLLKEVEENVCTLLGHPNHCPHGKPIPPGRCCEKSAREVARAVCPLKDLEVEDRGTIAYLATNDPGRLNRLMAMGALPGISVTMIQKFPSYVFQIGQSQFAVDKEMAGGIYVRLDKNLEK